MSHGFYVGSASPPQLVTLRLYFDYFAHEVAYELKCVDDGVILALAWFGTFDDGAETASGAIPVYGPAAGDREYAFSVWDEGGDGVRCEWGEGGYRLYLGAKVYGRLIASGNGTYGRGEEVGFVVEGHSEPTAGPTERPTPRPTR